jgi:hypothetical protein
VACCRSLGGNHTLDRFLTWLARLLGAQHLQLL